MANISAAFEDLRKQFFGGARVRFSDGTPKQVTVQTAATLVLGANPSRVGWAIVNKGTNPGHADYSNLVSTTRGFPVAQSGGTVTSKYTDIDGGETVKEALFGLQETAAGVWYVVAWELG